MEEQIRDVIENSEFHYHTSKVFDNESLELMVNDLTNDLLKKFVIVNK